MIYRMIRLFLLYVFFISVLGSATTNVTSHSNNELFTAFDGSLETETNRALADSTYTCGFNATHVALLDEITENTWGGWISRISGEEQVNVNGEFTLLTTRNSSALFNGTSLAFEYLKETLLGWYPSSFIEEDPYYYNDLVWKNLILTLPGTSMEDEIVILSAHYDSAPSFGPAPGADDNGSGSAALLEAARLLQTQFFPRTIRLIWFTGEEQGLRGSTAYVNDHSLTGVVGVINLDMYAYDSDHDRCFELHVGTLPQSDQIGRCLVDVIEAYNLNLSYDYLTNGATNRSDHASFWSKSTGAIEILENFFSNSIPGGCIGVDINPNYHQSTDTLDKINRATALDITKAALAGAFSMAETVPPTNDITPPSLLSKSFIPSGINRLQMVIDISEPSGIKLHYGIEPGVYSNSIENLSYNIKHRVTLEGIEPFTVYYMRVDMTDASGNFSFSDEFQYLERRFFSYFPTAQR